jgi:hypothetical protein
MAYGAALLIWFGLYSWENIWKVVEAVNLPNFGIRTFIPAEAEIGC